MTPVPKGDFEAGIILGRVGVFLMPENGVLILCPSVSVLAAPAVFDTGKETVIGVFGTGGGGGRNSM